MYRELRHVSPRSKNVDIGEDEAVVTREHPIVRKGRLDKHAFCLPAGVKGDPHSSRHEEKRKAGHAPSDSVTAPKHKIDARLFMLAMLEPRKRRPLPANGRTWRGISHVAHHEWFLLLVLLFGGRTRTRRMVVVGMEREAPRERVRDRGRWQGAREYSISAAVRSARRTITAAQHKTESPHQSSERKEEP